MRSRRHYHDDPRRAGQAISEFAAYKAKRVGALTEPGVFEMAESMPSWEWWFTYGGDLAALAPVAMKVLSKRSAASSCEHLWSKFKGVWSDARASLGVAKATKLVMLGSNLHIERKMFDLNIDRNLIKWQTEPEEPDDEA